LSGARKSASEDLANSLAAADALDAFRALPAKARSDFERWIEKAADEQAYWRRIETLALAMRAAPLLQPGPAITPSPVSKDQAS
jgi:hypothetical protein